MDIEIKERSPKESAVTELFAQEAVPESVPTWKRIQSGDKDATSKYLAELDTTITKAVNAYAGGDAQYKTQARIMAIDAAKSYDPNKGASIETYVYGQLRPLQRLAAQRGNLTRVSENVAQERNVVLRAIRELTADLGEDPTTEQIASRTGMSRKRIDALMNYRPVIPDSVAVSPEGDSLVADKENKALDLYDNIIYNELDNTDKKIYEWSTGYGKGEKLSGIEIAKRLKITPAAVSKRYKNIVQKFGEDREVIRRVIGGQR